MEPPPSSSLSSTSSKFCLSSSSSALADSSIPQTPLAPEAHPLSNTVRRPPPYRSASSDSESSDAPSSSNESEEEGEPVSSTTVSDPPSNATTSSSSSSSSTLRYRPSDQTSSSSSSGFWRSVDSTRRALIKRFLFWVEQTCKAYPRRSLLVVGLAALGIRSLLRRSALKKPLQDVDNGTGPQKAWVSRLATTFIAGLLGSFPRSPEELSMSDTLRRMQQGEMRSADFLANGDVLLHSHNGPVYSTKVVPGSEQSFFIQVSKYVPNFRLVKGVNLIRALQPWIPFVFLFVWWRVLRSLTNQNETFKGEGRERPGEGTDLVTFDDVVTPAKRELEEVVSYLNNPSRFKRAGARLPRGILLVGPSGTGKTLLARAVAGEARVPFLSVSASEFIEMYVGRGARRIRSLFSEARQKAPCVVFIDELDALGSRGPKRGASPLDTAHEEYVQTLNQLLTELDGFHGGSTGVVVIGATNRSNAIDPALLRSGRFDRHVRLQLPRASERCDILRLHVRRKSMKLTADALQALPRIAERANGLSGADLENLLNEAIFHSLRDESPLGRDEEGVRAGDDEDDDDDLREAPGLIRARHLESALQSFLSSRGLLDDASDDSHEDWHSFIDREVFAAARPSCRGNRNSSQNSTGMPWFTSDGRGSLYMRWPTRWLESLSGRFPQGASDAPQSSSVCPDPPATTPDLPSRTPAVETEDADDAVQPLSSSSSSSGFG